MIIENIQLTMLKPNLGYYLFPKNYNYSEYPVFSTEVCLSSNDSIDNWKEITEEEANSILKIYEELNPEDL